MKANRFAFGPTDDEGVTSVLGAILIAALLLGLLVVVRVQFVPVWEKNAEAAHMLQVENELSVLRAQIDRQASNTSVANVANQVTLGEARASIFAQSKLPSSITFQPDQKVASVDARNISIFFQNGELVPTTENDWITIDNTKNVTGVERALALRLRIPDPSTASAPEWVSIDVSGPGPCGGGQFLVELDSAPSQYVLRHTTLNANCAILTSISASYHIQTKLEPFYYVNVLEDNYLFDQVLANTTPPFSLTLDSSDGFVGSSYSIVYFAGDGGGNAVIIGSGGVRIRDFLREFSGGVIIYAANNNHYPAQSFVIEHGALILVQGDGAAFKVPPGFGVNPVGATMGVSITLPVFKGIEKSLSGQLVSIVNTQRGSGQAFSGATEAFNYTIETDYPDLWEGFLDDKFLEAGVPTDQYDITRTASSIRLMILGSSIDPDVNDISLSVTQADIRVRIEA